MRAGLDVQSAFRRRVAHRLDGVRASVVPGTDDGRIVALQTSASEPIVSALERSEHFCRDTSYGRTLHPGRPSYREVDRVPGLHLSIGPGDWLTVHLDLAAPAVSSTPGGWCVYERARALRHLLVDVLPLLLPGRRPSRPARAGARRAPPAAGTPWRPRPLPVPALLPAGVLLLTALVLRRQLNPGRRTHGPGQVD